MREGYLCQVDPDTAFPDVVCGAMWPADRAWFYAWDMSDQVAATVACDEELAEVLLGDGRYAAWRVEWAGPDPHG